MKEIRALGILCTKFEIGLSNYSLMHSMVDELQSVW